MNFEVINQRFVQSSMKIMLSFHGCDMIYSCSNLGFMSSYISLARELPLNRYTPSNKS